MLIGFLLQTWRSSFSSPYSCTNWHHSSSLHWLPPDCLHQIAWNDLVWRAKSRRGWWATRERIEEWRFPFFSHLLVLARAPLLCPLHRFRFCFGWWPFSSSFFSAFSKVPITSVSILFFLLPTPLTIVGQNRSALEIRGIVCCGLILWVISAVSSMGQTNLVLSSHPPRPHLRHSPCCSFLLFWVVASSSAVIRQCWLHYTCWETPLSVGLPLPLWPAAWCSQWCMHALGCSLILTSVSRMKYSTRLTFIFFTVFLCFVIPVSKMSTDEDSSRKKEGFTFVFLWTRKRGKSRRPDNGGARRKRSAKQKLTFMREVDNNKNSGQKALKKKRQQWSSTEWLTTNENNKQIIRMDVCGVSVDGEEEELIATRFVCLLTRHMMGG